jgi:hypothetical protein
LSTHDFQYDENAFSFVEEYRMLKKIPYDNLIAHGSKKLIIGNDVWIGSNTTVMGGLTIGDGAVIAANAVVTHDVPPYALAAGVPAQIKKYRFEHSVIERLLAVRWWEFGLADLSGLPFNNIDECLSILENIRTKKYSK